MPLRDPRKVIIEEGALEKLDNLLNTYVRPLCVTDRYIHSEYSEHLEGVISTDLLWKIVEDYSNGETIDKDFDVILGFGGGRSLDIAKLLARDSGLEWLSIPTAASHDGIASNVASVSQNGYRYSVKCKSPTAVVADLKIISKAPENLRQAGTGDIICKSSSLEEWRLAHEVTKEPFDLDAYSIVKSGLDSVINDNGLDALIRAEIGAGRAMSITDSSRPCSGTEHAISHAMDRRCQSLHGIQVAFATPLCLYFLNQAGFDDYHVYNIRNILSERGLPVTLTQMKISTDILLDDIHHALKIMKKRDRYSVFAHLKLNNKEIRRALNDIGYL